MDIRMSSRFEAVDTQSPFRERLAVLIHHIDQSDPVEMRATLQLIDVLAQRLEYRDDDPDQSLACKVVQLIKDTDDDPDSLYDTCTSIARYLPNVKRIEVQQYGQPIL